MMGYSEEGSGQRPQGDARITSANIAICTQASVERQKDADLAGMLDALELAYAKTASLVHSEITKRMSENLSRDPPLQRAKFVLRC